MERKCSLGSASVRECAANVLASDRRRPCVGASRTISGVHDLNGLDDLDLGWRTDIEVLMRSGASVEDCGDHLIVRTALNPTHHWGNYILVIDPQGADDADRWVEVFRAAFPLATWVAIALRRMPSDPAPWLAHELDLELDEVLTSVKPPRETPVPQGYSVGRLEGDDWEQTVRLTVDENYATGACDPASYMTFARARTAISRALCDSNVNAAAYFGAFTSGRLVASVGIVCCGADARYQNVLTQRDHRRRGLASHLLGLAGSWAAVQGCTRRVIVTERTNPAGGVYRDVGFALDGTNIQAYRPRSGARSNTPRA